MDKKLMGCCGIYCGSCDHYLSTQTSKEHLLSSQNSFHEKLKEHPCCGCGNSEEGKEPYWKKKCSLKLCNSKKDLKYCFECSNFPCDKLSDFRDSFVHRSNGFENLKIIMNEGEESGLDKILTRWSCQNCGETYSFYETTCNKCGEKINGFENDKRDR